ncbi:MAG TPA: pitrilysin family protein [Pyrinomonadaceae bacterium]|nr:pitrilysin family protein [Pyrinomonadaceae bacterium]
MAVSKENIRCSRLEGGPVVLSDTMNSVRSVTLGLFFRFGSGIEPEDLQGITHLIEHAVFKGTNRRSAKDIALEQDRLGGVLDAFTTHEEIGFIIKVPDDRLNEAFDLLADLVSSPKFDKKDIENEKRVILEEIKMTEDAPEEAISEIFHREAFRGHPLGRPITGTPKSLRKLTAENLAAYHGSLFTPQNLVIAAAGSLEHEKLVEMAQKLKESLYKKNIGTFIPQLSLPPLKMQQGLHFQSKAGMEQVHFLIGFPLVSASSPLRYAADLFVSILGGGTSSRLWQEVREHRGLSYSVGATLNGYRNFGFGVVNCSTSKEAAIEAFECILNEMTEIAEKGVSLEELTLAKEQARASLLLALEDTAARSASLIHCELNYSRQVSLEETLRSLEAVSLEEVNKLAKKYLAKQHLFTTFLGDRRLKSALNRFARIRGKFNENNTLSIAA